MIMMDVLDKEILLGGCTSEPSSGVCPDGASKRDSMIGRQANVLMDPCTRSHVSLKLR